MIALLLTSPVTANVTVAGIVSVAPPFTVNPATLVVAVRAGWFVAALIVTVSAAAGTTPPQPLQLVGSAHTVEVVPVQVQAAPKVICGAISMNTAIRTVVMPVVNNSDMRRMISSLKFQRMGAGGCDARLCTIHEP